MLDSPKETSSLTEVLKGLIQRPVSTFLFLAGRGFPHLVIDWSICGHS